MIPTKIPKFHANNVCKSDEYEENGKKTVVGWLKTLFLWRMDDEYSVPTVQDYKDYKDACSKFRSLISLPKHESLDEWEDQTTLKQQIDSLNRFRELEIT